MESNAERGWGRICTCAIPRHIGRNTDANSNSYTDCNGNSNTYCDPECNTQLEPDRNCNHNADAHTNSDGNCNRDGNAKAAANAQNNLYTEAPADAGPSPYLMSTLISRASLPVNLTILLLIPSCS